MFDMPITIPDRISTLELSKIWLYKAFQELEREFEVEMDHDFEGDREGNPDEENEG